MQFCKQTVFAGGRPVDELQAIQRLMEGEGGGGTSQGGRGEEGGRSYCNGEEGRRGAGRTACAKGEKGGGGQVVLYVHALFAVAAPPIPPHPPHLAGPISTIGSGFLPRFGS